MTSFQIIVDGVQYRILDSRINKTTIISDDEIVCSSLSSEGNYLYLTKEGSIYRSNENVIYQNANRATGEFSKINFPKKIKEFSCMSHILFLDEEGNVYGLGLDMRTIQSSNPINYDEPHLITDLPEKIISVECGYFFSLFLTESRKVLLRGNCDISSFSYVRHDEMLVTLAEDIENMYYLPFGSENNGICLTKTDGTVDFHDVSTQRYDYEGNELEVILGENRKRTLKLPHKVIKVCSGDQGLYLLSEDGKLHKYDTKNSEITTISCDIFIDDFSIYGVLICLSGNNIYVYDEKADTLKCYDGEFPLSFSSISVTDPIKIDDNRFNKTKSSQH